MPPSFRSAERHLVRFAGENDRGEKIGVGRADRKSTRLNSSHSQISYAVFCLKKKKIRLERFVDSMMKGVVCTGISAFFSISNFLVSAREGSIGYASPGEHDFAVWHDAQCTR